VDENGHVLQQIGDCLGAALRAVAALLVRAAAAFKGNLFGFFIQIGRCAVIVYYGVQTPFADL
jgi:hypothetical protein